MQLNTAANAVLGEFGNIIPEPLFAHDDAKREFLYTRALELQKLGIADSDKTVVIDQLDVSSRDGQLNMPGQFAGMMPAFVEHLRTNATKPETVRIVQPEDIPSYEGTRAIAFYSEPLRYRVAWNSWETGVLYLGYDGIEDMNQLGGTTDLTFPPAFWTMLVKKTALKAIATIRLKMAFLNRAEEKENISLIADALKSKEATLLADVSEWQKEFHRWINKDLNQQATLRRHADELEARRSGELGLNGIPSFLYSGD
jgi:hypothetical protein